MRNTPYSKSCNKTVRRFFDDFDLLPRELKEMIWDSPYTPDFDDLKAAWQLAEETGSFEHLLNRIKCLDQPKEKEPKKTKEERQRELANRRMNKYVEKRERERAKRGGMLAVYRTVRVDHTNDKHARLIKVVSDEEAMRLLSLRKETADIKPAVTYHRVFVGYVDPNQKEKDRNSKRGDKTPPTKDAAPLHITKQLHNAGGKK